MLTSPLFAYRVSGTGNGIELPFSRHALQFGCAVLGELDPRARHEIFHRLRDEHFARAGLGKDTGTDMDRKPAHLSVCDRAFSRVQSRSNIQSELPYRMDCFARALDSPGRPVECRQKAV